MERSELRIEINRFTRELLRDQRKTVGRLDSRFIGIERDAVGETPGYDPSYANIQGPYTAAFNDYIRRELGYESDLPYEILQHEDQREHGASSTTTGSSRSRRRCARP